MAACAVSTIIYGAEFPVWAFITNNYLQLLNANIILSFIISIYVYVDSFNVKKGNPQMRELAKSGHAGNLIYDFFIGRELNPRITFPFFGEVDLNAWLGMRPGLTGWALLDLAYIAKQYRTNPDHPAFANVTYSQTKRDTRLLTGGWWGMARHINYFAGNAVTSVGITKILDGRVVTQEGVAGWGILFTYFYSAWFAFFYPMTITKFMAN
ncbi:hypothetical protein LRP88_00094 [Fusarium phalaenopsidis]